MNGFSIKPPSRVGGGDFVDWQVPVSGDNGKPWAYEHATGVYKPVGTAIGLGLLGAADAAAGRGVLGLGTMATASETAYILAAGTRAGATSQAQAFNSGVVTGIVRPASDSATAVKIQNAAGTSDWVTVNTTTGTVRLAAQPANDLDAITRGYTLSRGMNLIANGSGLLGNNYNFSGLTFDPVETHGGGGSFSYAGAPATRFSDEYVPVDPEKFYRLTVWGKSGNADGSQYNSNARFYIGLQILDIDGLDIRNGFVKKHTGATDTTLAAALNPGDTTMTLTNAAGWNNTANFHYTRHIVWYPYTNSKGYSYPNYTYSRNHTRFIGNTTYSSSGMWAAGGISGNTVTLTAPWTGPTLAAGTPVRNAYDSDAGNRYLFSSIPVGQSSWSRFSAAIGSVLYDDITNFTFAPGTAFVKALFLNNYNVATGTNIIRWSDIHMSEITVRNLERFDANADLTLQSYTTADRPAAGAAGRVVWNTTTSRPNYDTGAAWILADGTAA